MSRRLVVIGMLALLPIVALTAISAAAGPDPRVASLTKQLRASQAHASDLQDEVDAQDGVIGDQADTIARLRYRLANQPDPLDVITSRGPDGLWQAMRAIWLAFPTLDPGALCGYDRSNVPAGDGEGLTLTSYSFYRWSGC